MTRDQELATLLAQCLAFYERTLTTFALSVWEQALAPFSIEQVRVALSAHAMDPDRGHFAPRPSDVVRALQGTTADRSLVAWSKVQRSLSAVGAYSSVAFDDSAIHCAITDLGGWIAICRTTYDELPHLERRFLASHRAHASRPPLQHPAYLVGVHEADNALRGHLCAPPILVGDQDRCRLVMRGGTMQPALSGPQPVAAAIAAPRAKSEAA